MLTSVPAIIDALRLDVFVLVSLLVPSRSSFFFFFFSSRRRYTRSTRDWSSDVCSSDLFKRGAENQAFLVESVTGIETLKAMAVEPQMQRRWEEQLAGYVAASFRVTNLGNTSSRSEERRVGKEGRARGAPTR